jgi:DNA-directed RNA polymerase specialized sigma24 family protein
MTDIADVDLVRPPFLELLDRDPDEAFRQFYEYTKVQLNALPPLPVRALPAEDRQDVLHDVVYHCVRDDFRVLRKYREQGYPFGGWLYVVAHRESLAYLRRKGIIASYDETPDRGCQPDADYRRLVDRVRAVLIDLKEYCRRLLLLSADEYTPLEIARVMGLPAEENKRIADQIRECRRQLKGRLEREGVDWRSWFES